MVIFPCVTICMYWNVSTNFAMLHAWNIKGKSYEIWQVPIRLHRKQEGHMTNLRKSPPHRGSENIFMVFVDVGLKQCKYTYYIPSI